MEKIYNVFDVLILPITEVDSPPFFEAKSCGIPVIKNDEESKCGQ